MKQKNINKHPAPDLDVNTMFTINKTIHINTRNKTRAQLVVICHSANVLYFSNKNDLRVKSIVSLE